MDDKELLDKLVKWEYFTLRGEFQYAEYVILELLAHLKEDFEESGKLKKVINEFYDSELHQKMKKDNYIFPF
jgi:hypothetical protein